VGAVAVEHAPISTGNIDNARILKLSVMAKPRAVSDSIMLPSASGEQL